MSGPPTHLPGLGDTLGGVSTQHILLSDQGLWALPGAAAAETFTGFPGQEQPRSLLETWCRRKKLWEKARSDRLLPGPQPERAFASREGDPGQGCGAGEGSRGSGWGGGGWS